MGVLGTRAVFTSNDEVACLDPISCRQLCLWFRSSFMCVTLDRTAKTAVS